MQFREIRTLEDAKFDTMMALNNGQYINGPWIEKVEVKMREIAKCNHTVAVSSGTMGLKIALKAMGIGEGDIVIVPDITFIVCATVVLELGAIPIFVDVDKDTFLLEEQSTIEAVEKYGDKIKAIMAVRLGGEEIPHWVYSLGIPVLIDSAHSMEPMDMRSEACVYSFHSSKIVSGIEGGIIATNNMRYSEKARTLRNFGFKDGDRIAHTLGFKANMSNVSAIIVWHNLNRLGATLRYRALIRDRFNAELGLNRQGLGMYFILTSNFTALGAVIPVIKHYPMSLSKMITGENLNEHAKILADHLVSIPFHEWLSTSEVDTIIATIKTINN